MLHLIKISAPALCLMLSGMAIAAESGPHAGLGMGEIKLAVKDYKTATDFYVKYFGMKEGRRFNPREQGLDWPEGFRGSSIILVHDETGHKELKPGTAWLVMEVADAKKLAHNF